MPLIHSKRSLAHTDEQKTEALFVDKLKRQCSPNYADVVLDHIDRVNQRVRTSLRNKNDCKLQELETASVEQVWERIKAARSGRDNKIHRSGNLRTL